MLNWLGIVISSAIFRTLYTNRHTPHSRIDIHILYSEQTEFNSMWKLFWLMYYIIFFLLLVPIKYAVCFPFRKPGKYIPCSHREDASVLQWDVSV